MKETPFLSEKKRKVFIFLMLEKESVREGITFFSSAQCVLAVSAWSCQLWSAAEQHFNAILKNSIQVESKNNENKLEWGLLWLNLPLFNLPNCF